MDPTLAGILTAFLSALFAFLATLYAAVYPLRKKYDELVKKYDKLAKGITYWRAKDYDVVLDGIAKAGKSALVARWINPTSDVNALGGTTGVAMQGPVHMCSEFSQKDDTWYEDRYRLVIYDVGGEHQAALGQVFFETKIKAAILVIDPTELDKSLARFSWETLQRTYLTTHTLDSTRGADTTG